MARPPAPPRTAPSAARWTRRRRSPNAPNAPATPCRRGTGRETLKTGGDDGGRDAPPTCLPEDVGRDAPPTCLVTVKKQLDRY
jgi:hypothetical protein